MDLFQSPIFVLFLLLVGIAGLTVAMSLRRRSEHGGINVPGRVCLVLLRMAIGWHFLVEGLEKFHTPNWSSEPYLREASGPLGPYFRDMAGDSLVTLLTTDGTSISPALDDEWQRYVDAFVEHYGLDRAKSDAAQKILDEAKRNAIVVVVPEPKADPKKKDAKSEPKTKKGWLVAAKPMAVKVEVSWPAPPVDLGPNAPPHLVDMTIAERLKIYDDLKQKVTDAEAELPALGKKGWPKWLAAKADAAKWRAELKQDLDKATADLKKKLDDLLSAEQHHKTKELEQTPTKKLEPLRRSIDWNRQLDRADVFVKWALVVVGVGLIIGCFTRLSAVVGAVLLLMFFLAMPPMPYLPDSPKAEGHYLYVNKNIIEMLALLALACLPTGRWAGLDGLLQFANPFNYIGQTKKPAAVPANSEEIKT